LQTQIVLKGKKVIEIAINIRREIKEIDIQLDGIHIIVITNAHMEGIIMNLIIMDIGNQGVSGKDTIENIPIDIEEENIIMIKEVT